MKRIFMLLAGLCLLTDNADAQSFANYLSTDGSSSFAAFNNNVLNGAVTFTIEYWVKTTESKSNGTYWQRPTMAGMCTAGNISNDFGITTDNGYIGFWQGLNSSADQSYQSSTLQINDNNWHHIALVDNGSTMTLFVDGNSIASSSTGNGIISTNAPLTIGATSLDFGTGGNNAANVNFFHQGQYAEMRVSNNARYTASFTPATSFTPDANTLSLLHFSGQCGVKINDASATHNDLVSNTGSASCTTLPLGSSYTFDGNTQYGITPAGMMNGLSVFTIEGWIKSTDLNVTPNSEVWRAPNIIGNSSPGAASGDLIVSTQAGYLSFYTGLNTTTGDNAVISKAFISDNQWHHWAVSVNGTNALLFADGVNVGNLPINRGLATNGVDALGLMVNNSSCCGGAIYRHSGQLDEVRFSSVARYATNFTPPTGTFMSDASTVVLYHLDAYNCMSFSTPDASGNNNSGTMYGYANCLPDIAYPSASAAITNVTGAEYFLDVDPGFGSGIVIPLTPAVTISSLMASINTSALSAGIHRLYLRTKSASGTWSETSEQDFLIDYNVAYPPAPPAITNIAGAEYFLDADPGFSNGTAIPFAPAVTISGLTASINTSMLSAGIHRLYLRSKSVSGIWSETSEQDFLVDYNVAYPSAPAAAVNVTGAEYFVDTDPGFGSGTAIATTAALDINNLPVAILTGALTQGVHRLYLRTKAATGIWSETSERDFLIDDNPSYPPAPAVPGNITKLEYFFDTDPGFGHATAVPVAPSANIQNYTFAVNTASLSGGNHTLFIRSYDDWSVTSASAFSVSSPLPVSWLSFTAAKQEAAIALQWKVNASNAVKYSAERSSNGSGFYTIGTLKARPVSGVQTYSLTDEQPLSGTGYYRIMQEDAGGRITYSAVLPVLFEAQQDIRIYPNPAVTEVSISAGQDISGTMRLFAADGRLVWHGAISGRQATIPLAGLAHGTYRLALSTGAGEQITKQIIKE